MVKSASKSYDFEFAVHVLSAVHVNTGRQLDLQDFTEEENHSEACRYHPGHFTFNILPLKATFRAHGDDIVLLNGWDCCHKDVKGHEGAVLLCSGCDRRAAYSTILVTDH